LRRDLLAMRVFFQLQMWLSLRKMFHAFGLLRDSRVATEKNALDHWIAYDPR
jgi:hypothetical protein